jgi:hypothetical protein
LLVWLGQDNFRSCRAGRDGYRVRVDLREFTRDIVKTLALIWIDDSWVGTGVSESGNRGRKCRTAPENEKRPCEGEGQAEALLHET